jgi:uncharacterized RDD family membrane protein YckC
LIRRLGQGGSGEVWEAEDARTQRHVALKALTAAHHASPDMLARFRREGRLAASVNHARCVFVFSAGEIDGCPVIVMELMRGGTLQDRLRQQGAMSVSDAVDTMLDVIDGLEAAHAAGILHRDIKPSNCFLDEAGRAKIGDFGISKTLESDSDLTLTGAFLGTPSYAAPEQVRGREVGLSSDIYSVGATLYALVTGAPPFHGASPGEVLARIVAERPTPFARYSGRIPQDLQRVILRALSKETHERFLSYADLRAALLPYSSGGLTTGGLARRLMAYVIDSWILPFWLVQTLLAAVMPGLGGALLGYVAPFAYYAALEKRRARTLGKHLLGLRVTTADGAPLTHRHVLLRTLVFFTVVSVLPAVVFAATRVNQPSRWSLLAYSPLLIFVTMRARNGYAGLHEVLSGTRVVKLMAREIVSVPDVPLPAATTSETESRHVGPYRVLGTAWRRGPESLSVAHDELLDRRVWIHEQPAYSARPVAELADVRPGRLHWLQGSRDGESAWDAYDAPTGADFLRWVRVSGRLTWAEVRQVVAGVAKELESLDAAGQQSARFGMGYIWVDSSGSAKLLDFPASGDSHPTYRVAEWAAFVREITILGLRGSFATAETSTPADARQNPLLGLRVSSSTPRDPGVPLPEFARPVARRLCADGFDSLRSLIDELEKTERRDVRVTRTQRLAPLLTVLAPGVLVLAIIWSFLAVGYPEVSSSGMLDLARARTYLRELRQLEQASDPIAAAPRREAISTLLAFSYERAQSDISMQSILARLPPAVKQDLAAIAAKYPDVSAADAAKARAAVAGRFGLGNVLARVRAWRVIVYVAAMMGLLAGIGSLALTALLGSPPLFRLFGIVLQRADGTDAGRPRCVLRSAVAWLPFLIQPLLLALPFLAPALFDLESTLFDLWLPFFVVSVAAAAIASAHALGWPSRGIADLVAGTHLVPR